MVGSCSRWLVLIAGISLTARVAEAQATPMSCASGPMPQMAAFDTSRVTDLAGAYDVVMIDTTSLRGHSRRHAGKLALWLQDSVPRRRGTAPRRTQKQFLVGSFDVAAPDSGEMWRRMSQRTAEAPGAFWSDGFLRLGEFGAKAGISLFVRSISATDLRGTWSSAPGTGIVVDFTGEREPDEAGYFCAKRLR